MKCPKCGYLGFEPVERCRNCGYDFSLVPPLELPELPIRSDDRDPNPLGDLALVDAAARQPIDPPASAATEVDRGIGRERSRPSTPELPLFGEAVADDEPLITKVSPPRAPLAVRRSTPEVPKVRSLRARPPMLDLEAGSMAAAEPAGPLSGSSTRAGEVETAALAARAAAVVIDILILATVDVVVIYFTLQICGLALGDLQILPKAPMVAFLLVQNGGYLIAFTAGGQTLGKMATGIRIVSTRPAATMAFGRSFVRTLVWIALAAPAGLGFLTTLFTSDRRGLHDRCAGTRVVRAS